MAKTSGRCVHCLRLTEEITDDHVFPHSWYPDSTPATVQRWTVPCCRECNNRLSLLETDLLLRLALCLDPASEAAAGLSSRALRSLGLDTTNLSDSEKEHRKRRKAKLKSELLPLSEIAGQPGVIPGLSRQWVGQEGQFAVPIPWAALSIIAEKIARGCEYKLKERYVETPYAIRTTISDPDEVSPTFSSHRRLIDFGPGCQVLRVFITEDPKIVRHRILIWGALCMHTLIDTEEYFRNEFDPRVQRVQGLPPDQWRGKMTIHGSVSDFV